MSGQYRSSIRSALQYQNHGTSGVADGSTNLTESNPPLITLTGAPYAPLLGHPGGKWYRDHGYPALPAGIDTTKPFGLHPQNPWPDALVLDVSEQATAGTSVQAFNTVIAGVAATNKAAVVDINGFFNNLERLPYVRDGVHSRLHQRRNIQLRRRPPFGSRIGSGGEPVYPCHELVVRVVDTACGCVGSPRPHCATQQGIKSLPCDS